MDDIIELTFSFDGNEAEQHRIDLYDVAKSLEGFQRSLALTTHLLLNDEVITKAPALKKAEIYAIPPEKGSWKITVVIGALLTGIYKLGTIPQNVPLGHIVHSAYDYVLSKSLGVHVDYNKTLGQLYKEKDIGEMPIIKESQLDSVIEKCSSSIKDMHRPIFKSSTAINAKISSSINSQSKNLTATLTMDTYEYINLSHLKSASTLVHGYISSYNTNTFSGRIYITELNRPIVFELSYNLRQRKDTISLIVNSLREHALDLEERQQLNCMVKKIETISGRLISYHILSISKNEDKN